MNIVVTGSLGHISKPLATELVKKNHSVTVISSNPSKTGDIEALGAKPAIGSLEDPMFLAETFKDADAVYLMVPPNFSVPDNREYYRQIGSNYAAAVRQTGVSRVVHLSSYGAHLEKGTGFILGSHDVEKIFSALSGVTVITLRPGYFYTNLYSFSAMIKGMGSIGSNYGGDDNIVMVDRRDIAAAVVEEIESADATSRVRYVASEDLKANDAARMIGNALGKPDMKWLVFSNEETQSAMEKNGLPAHVAANFVEMGAITHSGKLREDYDHHKPELGKVKFAEFAKEFAAAF